MPRQQDVLLYQHIPEFQSAISACDFDMTYRYVETGQIPYHHSLQYKHLLNTQCDISHNNHSVDHCPLTDCTYNFPYSVNKWHFEYAIWSKICIYIHAQIQIYKYNYRQTSYKGFGNECIHFARYESKQIPLQKNM